MRKALNDPKLLGGVLAGDSWVAWRILLIALNGERLTDAERVVFAKLTGREREPLQRCEEFWGVIGRRGGKSQAIAVLVVDSALLVSYEGIAAIGERLVVLCLAQNAKQAQVVFGYIRGIIKSVPMFARLIASETGESLSLTNGIDVEVRAASFRGIRGLSCVAVVCDEIAFWFGDEGISLNPDSAILSALRPSLATTNGLLAADQFALCAARRALARLLSALWRERRSTRPRCSGREPQPQSEPAAKGREPGLRA